LQPGGHRFEPGILHHPSLAGTDAEASYGWQAKCDLSTVARSAKVEGGRDAQRATAGKPAGCHERVASLVQLALTERVMQE
jgi:hypothetical protein